MRDIKFRGKSVDSRYSTEEYFLKMVYGQLIQRGGEFFILIDNGIEVLVDEETIGQYTGLNDKNFKRIYEGDIVEVVNNDKKFEATIVYEIGTFMIAIEESIMGEYFEDNWNDNVKSLVELHWLQESSEDYIDCLKVIGNICTIDRR